MKKVILTLVFGLFFVAFSTAQEKTVEKVVVKKECTTKSKKCADAAKCEIKCSADCTKKDCEKCVAKKADCKKKCDAKKSACKKEKKACKTSKKECKSSKKECKTAKKSCSKEKKECKKSKKECAAKA